MERLKNSHAYDENGRSKECDNAVVTGCFDFRLRARSFDLHQLAQHQKLKKLGLHISHNISASDSKTGGGSPTSGSPKDSPNDRRRRFIRVVRNSCEPDLENPHVVHRFSQEFLEQARTERSHSISEGVRPLPYVVTGRTILKKQVSTERSENDQPESPSANKHASFFNEVVVIEFDKKCTIRKDTRVTHRELLHDNSTGDDNEAEHTKHKAFLEMVIHADKTVETTFTDVDPPKINLENEVFLSSEVS